LIDHSKGSETIKERKRDLKNTELKMGFIPDDSEVNFIVDFVNYSDFNINIEPSTTPPPCIHTPLPSSLPSTPEPEIKSEFDDLPMEVRIK
jgi:hypothetical protein